MTDDAGVEDGRLTFRARPATGSTGGRDVPLHLGDSRDGVLYVPDTAGPGAPVVLFFHGAGGTGRRELRAVIGAADRYGAVVAAPDSRGVTWDIIDRQEFGPDVEFADRTLDAVADQCDVDFSRLAVGGISDGASYALSLGVTNGDLFTAVLAFSPGFMVTSSSAERARIFISHGIHDTVLPIDLCGRQLAGRLDYAGYDVTLRVFDGGHTVPPEIADAGFGWWVNGE